MRLAPVFIVMIIATSCSGGSGSSGGSPDDASTTSLGGSADGAAASPTGGIMTLRIDVTSESSTDAAIAYVEAQLVAEGLQQWDVTTDGSRITFTVDDVEQDQATDFSLDFSTAGSSLEARPVVAVAPDRAAADAFDGDKVEDQDGLILVLGDGVSLADEVVAVARYIEPRWEIQLAFTAGGIDYFNSIAGRCFGLGPECPTGKLALVLDGRVLMAPSVQAPTFEADQIVISGSFTESEATDVAAAITSSGSFEIDHVAKMHEPG